MRRTKAVATSALVLAVIAGAVLVLTAQVPPARLPGLVSPDPYPRGCVDCHKAQTGGADHRLNVSLNQVARHPDITAVVKSLPEDCAICHKAGTAAQPMDTILHKSHYGKRLDSVFVRVYGGDCLSCHAIDTTSFAVTVKTAPKNW